MSTPDRVPATHQIRFGALCLVAALLTVAGCGFSKDAVKQTTGSSRDGSAGPSAPAGSSANDKVTLLSAGHGAKSALRLHFHKGDRATARFTLRLSVRTTIDGRTTSVVSPPVHEDLAVEVLTATATTSTVQFTIVDAGADTDPLATDSTSSSLRGKEDAALRKLRGLGGTVTMNDRAMVTASNVHVPSSVEPATRTTLQQLREQIVQLSRPLPAEPVGVGARWTVDQPVTLNGISVHQRATYRLAAHHGRLYSLDISGEQTAKLGPAKVPDLPATDKVRITGWKVAIDGSTDLDLTQVLALTATGRTVGDLAFHVDAGTDSGDLKQHLDLRLAVQPP